MRKERCKRGAKPDSLRPHLNRFVECESNRFRNQTTSLGGLVRIEPVWWLRGGVTTLSIEPPQVRKRYRRPLARASPPQFPSPHFAECQPFKRIVRGSRYDTQQVLRAAVLLGWLRHCLYSSDYAPPRIRSRSSSSSLTCR